MRRATDPRTADPDRGTTVGVLVAVLLALAGVGVLATDDGAGPAAAATATSGTGRTSPAPTSPAPAVAPTSPAPAVASTSPAPAVATTPGGRGDAPVRTATTPVPVRDARLTGAVAPATVPPVGLTIASLDVTVPVDPVGVRPDGQMEVPPLAERAGWYRFGSSPADPDGTAVIAAHVDSAASAGLGPFARLLESRVGDVVDVSLADGSVRRYAVTSVERRAKPEIAWSDVFVRDGGARLVLVTCGGSFQRDAGRYSDNVIVTAEPVGSPPLAAASATGGG